MKKTLILHDLSKEELVNFKDILMNYTIFSALPTIAQCIGCFNCWVKTPCQCVIKDRGREFSHLLAKHNELIVISRNLFGGFSPSIKAVIDRSIGYILPYFEIRDNNEMHHKMRYPKSFNLKYLFYGTDIFDEEKEIAHKLVAANAQNFGSDKYEVRFYPTADEAFEVLK